MGDNIMGLVIQRHNDTCYIHFPLSGIDDTKKLYIQLIEYHRKGLLINVIKNSNSIHLIAIDSASMNQVINEVFNNPQVNQN